VTALGTADAVPRLFGYNLFEWADDFSYLKGKHSLKTGVDIRRIRDNASSNTSLRGNYAFNSLVTFLAGTPNTLGVTVPGQDAYRGYRQTLFGIYGQDDINVSPRLTLNLGLRWEASTDPTEVNGKVAVLPSPSASQIIIKRSFFTTGKKNFEPRAGFAWRLSDSGKPACRPCRAKTRGAEWFS